MTIGDDVLIFQWSKSKNSHGISCYRDVGATPVSLNDLFNWVSDDINKRAQSGDLNNNELTCILSSSLSPSKTVFKNRTLADNYPIMVSENFST